MSDGKPPSKSPSLDKALASLPIFPLRNVVLFPGTMLPLRVFEPRYRAMLADCLSSHRALAIAQLLEGQDEWGQPLIAAVAGGGIIVEHEPLVDGRSNIVVLGQKRLALEVQPPDFHRIPYRTARARVLVDLTSDVPDGERTALASAAAMFSSEVQKYDPNFSFELSSRPDPGSLADSCAFHLVIDAAARQAALEELDPRVRVRMVKEQLALQHGTIMKVEGKVLN